jgi:hypothetical protein
MAYLARVWYLGGVAALLGGCGAQTVSAHVVQPNPITRPEGTVVQSKDVTVETSDMALPRAISLRQSANFAVVSRDRLRFHVTLSNRWMDAADIRTWRARLVDDRGNEYKPQSAEHRFTRRFTKVWVDDRQRALQKEAYGTVTGPGTDSGCVRDFQGRPRGCDPVATSQATIFEGTGDLVFFAPGMFDANVKSLTLYLWGKGRSKPDYAFTWKFVELDEGTAKPVVRAPR